MVPDLSVIPCGAGFGPRQSSDCPENAGYHPACTCTALLVLLDLARAKSSRACLPGQARPDFPVSASADGPLPSGLAHSGNGPADLPPQGPLTGPGTQQQALRRSGGARPAAVPCGPDQVAGGDGGVYADGSSRHFAHSLSNSGSGKTQIGQCAGRLCRFGSFTEPSAKAAFTCSCVILASPRSMDRNAAPWNVTAPNSVASSMTVSVRSAHSILAKSNFAPFIRADLKDAPGIRAS